MNKVCHVILGHDRYDPRVFRKECSSLNSVGYDVTLLCSDSLPDETNNGVKIISAKYAPKNKIDELLFAWKKLYTLALQIDADLYHIHEPALLPLAKKLKRKGKKVIFDSHENTVADIKSKRYIPKILRTPISFLYGFLEKKIVEKLDWVITVNPSIVQYFKKFHQNVSLIPNFPIYTESNERLPNENRNVICFAGMVDPLWSIDKILDAIQDVDVKFLCAGRCSEDYLNLLKQKAGYSNTRYFEFMSPKEVRNEIYDKSSIGMCVLQYNDNCNGKEGTLGNTKFFEYMMMGMPIICSDFILWKQIVEKNQCGICVNPEDIQAIKSAIVYLIEHEEEAVKMGENGKRLVKESYNWELLEKELVKVYRRLLT